MITLDLHVHTVHSGDSPCKVEEAIQIAKDIGLDGIAITDHDTVDGLKDSFGEIEDDFLVIPGIEVSSEDGHVLGLGVNEKIPPERPASEAVENIREKGGIAVAAHPFSLSSKPFSVLSADFDAVEVFNPRRYMGNRFAKKYAEQNDIPMAAGSDAHFPEEIGMAGVKLDCELELDTILESIKSGEASVFGSSLPFSAFLKRALFRLPGYK